MPHTQSSAGANALFLTILAAMSQALAFVYRVALSRTVGAEVMGLYQLLMPAYSVMLSLVSVGLTACNSNLSAQYLALGNGRGMEQTRRMCLALLFGGCMGLSLLVLTLYDPISVYLLGDARTQLGLVLLLPCVLLTGIENLHKHVFYGAGVVRPPAFVELAEQGIRAAAVLGLLICFVPQNAEHAVGLIVAGMVLCEVFSAGTLALLFRRQFAAVRWQGKGERWGHLLKRIGGIALPVSLSSLLGNLMGAANAILIPRKLVEGGMGRSQAVSEFGIVCGMTLPMLTLPTVFLGALNLVMVPGLARSMALQQRKRIQRQVERVLTAVSVLILPAMTWMMVMGPELAQILFREPKAGEYILLLAPAVVFSCYHAVFSGVLNGVGKQGTTALVSLICDGVQLAFVFTVPMPGVGMGGYVAGVLASELLGMLLCARQAIQATGASLPVFRCLTAPGLASLLMGLTANLLFRVLKDNGLNVITAGAATLAYSLILYLAALQAQGLSVRGIFRLKMEK